MSTSHARTVPHTRIECERAFIRLYGKAITPADLYLHFLPRIISRQHKASHNRADEILIRPGRLDKCKVKTATDIILIKSTLMTDAYSENNVCLLNR